MSSTTAEHDARARVIDENYKKILEFYVMDGQTWLGSLLRSMAAVINANFDRKNNSEYRKKVMEEFHKVIADPRFDTIAASDKPMSAVLSFGKVFGAAFEDMIERTTHGSMLFEPATIAPFSAYLDGSAGRKRRNDDIEPSTSSAIATTSSDSMRSRPSSGAKAHRSIAIPARRTPTSGGNYLKKPPPGDPIYSLPVTDFTFPRRITDPMIERRQGRNGTPPTYDEESQLYDPMLAQPFLRTGRPMFDSMLDDSDSPPPQPKARAERKMKTPKQEVVTPAAKRATPKMMTTKSVKKEDSVADETVREWAVDCFEKQAVCFVCDKVCPNYHSVSNHLYHQHKGVCQENYIFRCDGCTKQWSSFRGALGHVRTAIRMNGIGCKNKMTYVWELQNKNDEETRVEQIDDIEEEEGARMEDEGEGMEEGSAADEPVIKAEVDEENGEQGAPEM